MQKEPKDDITVDGVFGYVMSKPDNCLHLLRSIFPDRQINWIKPIEQRTANNGELEKNTRFDVWAKDNQGRIYDCEMQKTFDDSLGQRLRYYQSELDRLTLKQGEDYRNLKSTVIIFFFNKDYFRGNHKIYHAKMMIEEGHERKLVTNLEILFLNPQGQKGEVSPDLQAFLDYMNGKITKDNSWIEKLDREVKEYIASPEWRHSKMNLAVKISDAKYEGEIVAKREAMKKMIKNYRNLGVSKDKIVEMLLNDYGDSFPKKDIIDLIKEVK